jgi:glycosyltransferase involved in cell wall biosynthesis
MQVHQFYPTVTYGDAVSNQILSLQRLLRHMGYRSEIFCEHLPLHFEGRARQVAQYARYSSSANILLLHFSMAYSDDMLSWLQQVPDRKIVIYHNITPHPYFASINEVYFEAAQAGRAQLDRLRVLADVGWGDSTFNCQELAERGWTHLGVLPIVFDPRRYAVRPDRKVLKRWQGGVNVLFVGRISPNKRFEDVIIAFYYLKRFVRQDARLLLVGSARGMESYREFLQALVARLGLSDVVFTGHVSTSQLVAYYQCASVYLSMSRHEGFGMPLLESMHFNVPIVAYKAAAVPETMGGSGVLVTTKDHVKVAELIGLLVEDEGLRARIVARQRERLRDFLPEKIEGQLRKLLHDAGGEQATQM